MGMFLLMLLHCSLWNTETCVIQCILPRELKMIMGAGSGNVCHISYDCGKSSCCRDSLGHVLSSAEGNGMFGGLTGPGPGPLHHAGTCSTKLAQKGEMCDGSCTCAPGLRCYRPMSGVCCPPQTCMDEAYVIKQQHYWSNCMSDPNCFMPP